MTTKSSQLTNESGQDATELHAQIEALSSALDALISAIQQKTAQCDELRADIIGLMDELAEARQAQNQAVQNSTYFDQQLKLLRPELAELKEQCKKLQWDYDEAMRQYDEAQKRACEAEARAEQTTKNALEANHRWKEKVDVLTDLHKLTTQQAIKKKAGEK